MSVGTTTAIIGGAALAGGATVAGGLIAKSGAEDAAATGAAAQEKSIEAQTKIAQEGLDIQKQQYADSKAMIAPFVQNQLDAQKKLAAFADPNNPYYQAQSDLATKQIQQQLASQGLLRSRSQGDSLAQLQLGLTGQRLGVLQNLSGSGAVNTAVGASQQYGAGAGQLLGQLGGNVGSSLTQMGQIQAQGALGQAQAIGGMVSGIGNTVQGSIGSLTQLKLIQSLTGKQF